MSVIRYEELDQLAGELLPERTLLSLIDLDILNLSPDKDCCCDK